MEKLVKAYRSPHKGASIFSSLSERFSFGAQSSRCNTVTIDEDLGLHYMERGRGEAVVFVPGFTFSSEVFEHQFTALSTDYRVIVLDPRSHGRSSMTINGNNYPQHGRDLNVLFTKLKLSNFTLIGWSFGALSAWSYVEQFGTDKLKSFVCIDMPPAPISADENKGAWVEGSIAELAAGYHVVMEPVGQKAFMAGYAEHVMVQRDLSAKELDWITSLSLQTPSHAVTDLFASGLFSNYLKTAQSIDASIPNLFFVAEHWAEIATAYINKEMPNASVDVLGGHMMFWEYPEKFNRLLGDFLTQNI